MVVRRIFSLISRPLNDFEDIYYPSFAEWVTSKARDSKCYINVIYFNIFISSSFIFFIIHILDQSKTSGRSCFSQVLYICILEEASRWSSR